MKALFMKKFETLFNQIPELKEQYELFENTLLKEDSLEKKYIKWVAFSTALALKEKLLISLVEEKLGKLEEDERKAIFLASSRMAVTNPYFMARNIQPLSAGGSLDSLNMSVIQNLGVEDMTAYHYACISISSINSGFVCFNSHLQNLKAHKQSDFAIDQAMRLTASLHSLKQLLFNVSLLN